MKKSSDKAVSGAKNSETALPRPRSVEQREQKQTRLADMPHRAVSSIREGAAEIKPVAMIIVLLLALFLIVSVAVPVRNYFQQRSQIKQALAAQEQSKEYMDQIQSELNQWNNESYVREQARIRLGVVEPGETAYRIIDPRISVGSGGAVPGEDESETWYAQLWDSISTPQEPPVVVEPAPGDAQ